jgi:hypothetical protein
MTGSYAQDYLPRLQNGITDYPIRPPKSQSFRTIVNSEL